MMNNREIYVYKFSYNIWSAYIVLCSLYNFPVFNEDNITYQI